MKKQKQAPFPGFERCLQMLHKRDAMTQEEGYFFLSSRAHEYLDQLLAALSAEKEPYIQGWLLEFIGEAKSPVAFPILLEYWYGDDKQLREWAESGLAKLGTTKEGRQVLWEAHLYGVGLPQFETEEAARKVREDLARFIEGSKD